MSRRQLLDDTETPVTNEKTGGIKGTKLARLDLIPPGPLLQLAEHYGRNVQKYPARNWEKGLDWGSCYAALMRHAIRWWAGEDEDGEGFNHLVAVAWHAFALLEYTETHPELDNRPYRTGPNQ